MSILPVTAGPDTEVRVHRFVRYGVELFKIELLREGARIVLSPEQLSLAQAKTWTHAWLVRRAEEEHREALH